MNNHDLVMNIKTEPVEIKSEPEVAAAASSSNEPTRDFKSDPERQWVVCPYSDEIKKEPLRRTCEKCGRVTMVKNHKCERRCKICDKKLKTKGSLINHLQNIHRAEPDCEFFECDFCGLRYQQKRNLINHLKLKHEGGKIDEFECDYDGKIFKSKARLYGHMKNCHRLVLKCEVCGKEFKNLESHMRYAHLVENTTQTACKICNKTFNNKMLLSNHLKFHNKQFECHICKKKFATAYHLKIHLKVYDNPQAFQFEIFNNPSYIKHHKKFHDKTKIKSHKCGQCDFATDTSAQFQIHQKVHDQNHIKDLKCPKCNFATNNKITLKRHIETHNPHRTKYPCLQCDYKAATFGNLKLHVQIHNLNRVKDQKCPHCNYVTYSKTNLNKHITIHDKIKSFKCQTCEKSFHQKAVLKRHVEIHNINRTMIPCPQCNFRATRKAILRDHITRMHDKTKK
jgi:KRAB domain-containing zinc finger protein